MTCVSFTVLLFHECYRHGITPMMSLFTLNLHNPTPNRIHTWICTSAGYIQQKNAVTQNAKSINFCSATQDDYSIIIRELSKCLSF